MIRLRLITLAAVAVVAGALSAATATGAPGWTFVSLAALGVAYAAQTRYRRRNLMRLAIALSLFWPMYAIEKRVLASSAPDQLQSSTRLIAGTVRTPPAIQTSGGTTFEMSVVTADDAALAHPITVQVQLPDRRTGPIFGQYVLVTGMTTTPLVALNPGEEHPGVPSPGLFLASDVQSAFTHSPVLLWGRWTAHTRDLIERRARSLMSYRAYGLLDELLLHRRLFGAVERQLFSATGTSHLLAISGLHLGLVFAMMTLLFGGVLSTSSVGRTLAPLLGTLTYLAFIDFPLSADRAFVMLCILTLSRLAGSHVSRLAALSWAALVLTLVDPASVFDIGLQLSFASVGGLLFIGEPLSRHVRVKNGFLRALLRSLSSTIGASLPAAALAIPTFHALAPISLLANLAAIPAVSVLLPVLFVWSVLLVIALPLAAFVAPVINLAAGLFFGSLDVLARLPLSHVNIPAPAPVTFLSLGILFAVIVLTVDNQPRLASRRHGAIAIVAALLLVTMTFVVTVSPSDTRVTFPVVDQGGVVLVRDRNAGTVLCLCDTNAKAAARATRAVAALGVNRLDAVVFSGEPEDLPEQLDALFAALSPLRVWIPSECMTGPISGLDDRFQATMGSLSPHQMVQLARADSTIRVGTGSGSEPVLSIAAGLLAGTAGTITSSQTRAPGFTYDIDAGIVAVATPEGVSRIQLAQTGCITVFMRGSRCWVAPDLRR